MRCVNGGFVVARFRFLLAASQGRCVGLRRVVPAQPSPSQPPPHGWVDAIVAGVGRAPMLDAPEAVDVIERFLDAMLGSAAAP